MQESLSTTAVESLADMRRAPESLQHTHIHSFPSLSSVSSHLFSHPYFSPSSCNFGHLFLLFFALLLMLFIDLIYALYLSITVSLSHASGCIKSIQSWPHQGL